MYKQQHLKHNGKFAPANTPKDDCVAYWVRGFDANGFQLSNFEAENGNGGGGNRNAQLKEYVELPNGCETRICGWKKEVRLVAIIIGHPHSKLVKDEILPNLEYWHRRSSEYMDILYVGLATKEHWANLNDKNFVSFLEMFEEKTSFHYSGETDIILCNSYIDVPIYKFITAEKQSVGSAKRSFGQAVQSINERSERLKKSAQVIVEPRPGVCDYPPVTKLKNADGSLPKGTYVEVKKVFSQGPRLVDLSKVYSVTFERALEDKAIDSPGALIEKIIYFAQSTCREANSDPASLFSDSMGRTLVMSGLKSLLLSLLPQELRNDAKKLFHHAMRKLPQANSKKRPPSSGI